MPVQVLAFMGTSQTVQLLHCYICSRLAYQGMPQLVTYPQIRQPHKHSRKKKDFYVFQHVFLVSIASVSW